MPDYRDKLTVYAECDRMGESAVRAQVLADAHGTAISFYKREWLEEKNAEHNSQRETEERKQNLQVLAAAEKSAIASELSAVAAKESARWAMWAVIVALAAIITQLIVK